MSGAEGLLGAAIAGGLISASGSIFGGHQSNSANIRASREQMAFQERMSNSAHQRQVQDMRKAGINPLYMYAKGAGGSSSPGGAMANSQNVTEGLGEHFGRVMEAKMAKATMQNLDATNAEILSRVAVNSANAKQMNAQVDLISQNIASVKADLNKKQVRNKGYEYANKAIQETERFVEGFRSGNPVGDYYGGLVKVRKKGNK